MYFSTKSTGELPCLSGIGQTPSAAVPHLQLAPKTLRFLAQLLRVALDFFSDGFLPAPGSRASARARLDLLDGGEF